MALSIYDLNKELTELCIKCTKLKPSTAKQYAKKLFSKHSKRDGCISYYSEDDYRKLANRENEYRFALRVLKTGFIKTDDLLIKVIDVSSVDFRNDLILITTFNSGKYKLSTHFNFLKLVFN